MNIHTFAFAPEFWTFFIILKDYATYVQLCAHLHVGVSTLVVMCIGGMRLMLVAFLNHFASNSWRQSLQLNSELTLRDRRHALGVCFSLLTLQVCCCILLALNGLLISSLWPSRLLLSQWAFSPFPIFLYCLNNEIFLSLKIQRLIKNNCVSTRPSLWNI